MLGTSSRNSREARPRIFMKKSQRRVERRAAPHLEAEEIWQTLRDRGRRRENVVGANARRHQRLMRVAESRVGDEQALFFARPRGEFLRAELLQHLARAGRRLDARRRRKHRGFEFAGNELPFYLGIAVENHVAEIRKHLGGAIAAASGSGKAPANDRETKW